jgi:hypothetical protein
MVKAILKLQSLQWKLAPLVTEYLNSGKWLAEEDSSLAQFIVESQSKFHLWTFSFPRKYHSFHNRGFKEQPLRLVFRSRASGKNYRVFLSCTLWNWKCKLCTRIFRKFVVALFTYLTYRFFCNRFFVRSKFIMLRRRVDQILIDSGKFIISAFLDYEWNLGLFYKGFFNSVPRGFYELN